MLDVLGTEHTASISAPSSGSGSISAIAEATGAAKFEASAGASASVDFGGEFVRTRLASVVAGELLEAAGGVLSLSAMLNLFKFVVLYLYTEGMLKGDQRECMVFIGPAIETCIMH